MAEGKYWSLEQVMRCGMVHFKVNLAPLIIPTAV